ncbi:DNA-directed RNA polymerase III subunit RPC3-like [Pyrgilauda ruficollis]|uniref:DNA-directed RNA polymerase III subunit RPC3-like n=1 Tax=Pyrgilauda ruficollis TaxID=221976 RepID=UPI001B8848E9|nr:DNA-directed RNA polymerase III subunit RPC3-like [Pyrgilauda ruficollis]
MSSAVARVADRLTETMEDGKTMDYTEVSNTFVRLADTHFIQRCPTAPEVPQNAKVPAGAIAEQDMYAVPRICLGGESRDPGTAGWDMRGLRGLMEDGDLCDVGIKF